MSGTEEQLVREAVRLYRRYAVEIVEALGFCPYAERARVEGRTREVVMSSPLPTDAEVLVAIEAIADDPRIEIGLILLPQVGVSRPSFGRWVELLRKAHAVRHGGTPILALEGFHPDARADTSNAERLTPFVRRTPDPTVQLTRLSVLDRVRRGTPQGTAFFDPSSMDVSQLLGREERAPLHERIAEHNRETVLELGVAAVSARIEAILRDRDETYARLGLHSPR